MRKNLTKIIFSLLTVCALTACGTTSSSLPSSISSLSSSAESTSSMIASSSEEASSPEEASVSSQEESSSTKPEEESKMPTVTTHITKRVPLYADIAKTTKIGVMMVDEFNNSTVGYFALSSFVPSVISDSVYQTQMVGYCYTILNTSTGGTCTIDFEHQTITYNTYDRYLCMSEDGIPFHNLNAGGHQFFIMNDSTSRYVSSDEARVIDLSKYNIPLYYQNGDGYLPIELFKSLLFPKVNMNFNYNGQALYMTGITSLDDADNYRTEATNFTSEYMEYTYNLLAMNLDNRYGLDEKKSFVDPAKTNFFLPNGAYAALTPYHDQLTSLEMNVACSAYFQFFAENLDDGGHSGMTGYLPFIDTDFTGQVYGQEFNYTSDISEQLKELRKTAGYNPTAIVKSQIETQEDFACNQAYQEIDGVAYLTFDGFTVSSEMPETIDSTNYFQDTICLTSYANSMIKAHNIKKVVLDLSVNGGGAIPAEQFVASWICGGVTSTIRNTIDKTFSVQTEYADINFDGVYDDNDYIGGDVDVYCITSICSFSCGNFLPVQLKEQSLTKFIGGQSGGGSCSVLGSIPTGLIATYQISGPIQLGKNSSTSYDDFTNVEDGVTPDFYAIGYTAEEAPNFYNRTALNAKILADVTVPTDTED